ncbi:DUF2804 domain-containing protein [Microbacterium sp. 2FI]|uniref:DUF2804 domain-containing protein n=1 Tax=Microbacterium sp. 2FI TaxID=2502193 RepID=UPI0010F79056|nr:DUF2804 domain-containing protein [Microbacterium sp. 2FI]
MIERELTSRQSLTGTGRRLNGDAVGWMRAPLLDTSGIDGRRSWGRNKRWEYWNVMTPTHIVALTVSSLDYAAVHDVWVFDRAAETAVHRGVTGILSGSATLPASLGDGPARARARDLTIDIDEVAEGTRLRAQIPGASVDIVAARPPVHESLAVVVPWSDRRFQYTVKDVARPATGTITVDGVAHDVPAGESWAVLDHGRGRWPYDVSWNWGAGSGVSGGRVIGVQLGGQWTDGTGSTENAMFVDGRLHKISEELRWEYDTANFLRPWRVHGETLDLTFVPFYDKVTRTDLGIVSSRTDQCFGWWSGRFTSAEGEAIAFEGIQGWAEDVRNRW